MAIKKWCNTHQRDAERCKTEGGIMLPCRIIDCAEVGIEIFEEDMFSDNKTLAQVTKGEVIRNLSRAWETVPEWRMGQLMFYLATIEEATDVFNLTDERLITSCRNLINEGMDNVYPLHRPLTRDAYLQQCKEALEEGDYLDILCGIHEVDFYAAMEEDLKSIVDTYFSYSK